MGQIGLMGHMGRMGFLCAVFYLIGQQWFRNGVMAADDSPVTHGGLFCN